MRALLARDFVSILVDATDDELPSTREATQHFNVVGTPTMIVISADGTSEVTRFHSFVTPDVLTRALRAAAKRS